MERLTTANLCHTARQTPGHYGDFNFQNLGVVKGDGVVSVVVHLLGEPRIERDGEVCKPPRGHKTWALLAYLILGERPPSRRKVAEILFSEANDPLAALRWTLSEMRRSVGWSTEVLGGDPLTLALPDGHSIDLLDLALAVNV